MEGEDKYFTPDKFTRVFVTRSQVWQGYCRKNDEAVQHGTSISDADVGNLLEEYKSYPTVCCCAAHLSFRSSSDIFLAERSTSDRFYANSLNRLILLPPLLNDHYGYELAVALLPFLLNKVSDDDLMVNLCLPGSLYTVNFVLRMPLGRAYQFTGRPDFSIDSLYCSSIARFTLRGVGEVQSPPVPQW